MQPSTQTHPPRLAPSGGVIHLVRALEEEGVDYACIRDALTMDFSQLNEKNTRIEADKIKLAYRLAMELKLSDDFWLRLGDSYSVHNYHLELSNWILTGKNFADILPKLHGLYGLGPDESLDELETYGETDIDDGEILVQPFSSLPVGHRLFRPYTELSAATLVRGYKSLLGDRDMQFKFYFEYPAPDYHQAYRDILGENIVFDAAATEVHIPRNYLFQTFISSDPVMHQYYERQLSELLEPRQESGRLVNSIETILLSYHGNFPSLVQICNQLNMGERTLRRSLNKLNTSYRQILLNTKMKRAEYYLRETDISIEEIAYRLDYSDYANFRRAFQANYGQSPSRYRKQIH
jgi:AraC-like DNA-binding protein